MQQKQEIEDVFSQQIIEAVKECNAVELQSLLESKANVDYQDEDGRTGLMWASAIGDLQSVQLLLQQKSDIHRVDRSGSTALMYAAEEEISDCLKILLDNKAAVNHTDNTGDTALILAAKNGSVVCVKLLLEHNGTVDHVGANSVTGLFHAVCRGHVECAKMLLERNASVDHADEDGQTGLIHAAYAGYVDSVALLLQYKADVGHADEEDGWTALTSASFGGSVECVEFLLEKKADVNHRMNNGETALSERCLFRPDANTRNLLGFLLLSCGAQQADADDEDMEIFAEMKTRITAYHTDLKQVLSEEVVVDTCFYVEEHGLYHEPLERVMEYCGFNLMSENDPNRNEDDPIPQLLRGHSPASSALYWWNQLQP